MSNDKTEQWELVVGGDVKDGVLVGGEVKGTFPSRGEAEAEGARIRRGPEKIRARLVGDTPERLAERRAAARMSDAERAELDKGKKSPVHTGRLDTSDALTPVPQKTHDRK